MSPRDVRERKQILLVLFVAAFFFGIFVCICTYILVDLFGKKEEQNRRNGNSSVKSERINRSKQKCNTFVSYHLSEVSDYSEAKHPMREQGKLLILERITYDNFQFSLMVVDLSQNGHGGKLY